MKSLPCLAAVSVFIAIGCNDGASDAGSSNADDESVGTLQMSLTGTDSENQQYRLRDATFQISGTRYDTNQSVYTSVSSEDDLESPLLRTKLIYGYYYVSLPQDGWYLERITPEGTERVEHAVLLTPSSLYANIQQGAVTQVAFQFGVDGELIDFIGGSLEIGIGIQHAPEAGAENPGN